jgi:hypothetical protein
MRKVTALLLVIITFVSCQKEVATTDYVGVWIAVQEQNGNYVIVDCGTDGVSVEASSESIIFKDVMEDSDVKIDHVNTEDNATTLFIDKSNKSWYKFSWKDEPKGIARWDIMVEGNPLKTIYAVSEKNAKNIRHVKGGADDCITGEDVGDVINDSTKTDSGNLTINIEDSNCISIKSKAGEQLLEHCFEVDFVELRNKTGDYVPLTFISGKMAVEADFYNTNNNWTATKITYFDPAVNNGKGKTFDFKVNLKDFDFNAVTEKAAEN